MLSITLYSREDCHLCDVALEELETFQKSYPHEVNVVNIDKNPDLEDRFGTVLPVLEAGSYRIKAPVRRRDIQGLLEAVSTSTVSERADTLSSVSERDRKKVVWGRVDDFTYWFSRHYLAVFNSLVFIYILLPFLAPVFYQVGLNAPANLIYRGYGLVCHQLSFRSFFIAGEQIVYPREAVGFDHLHTFEAATGISEGNSPSEIFSARNYVGEEHVGYKVALCQRDLAIYAAILLFGLIFGLSGRRIPPLPWYLWVLLGIVPIGLDGLSQLVSQPPFSLLLYRESTPFLRVLTGAMFGFTTAWFGYPLVEETMRDTRELMKSKKNQAQKP